MTTTTSKTTSRSRWKLSPKGEEYIQTKEGRVAITSASFFQYMMCYYAHLFTLSPADFHKELIATLEDVNDFIAILGFRGSAKSTILELYAEWCMVTGRSPFTIYIGSTEAKSKMALMNIKARIEENKLLQVDYDISIDSNYRRMTDKWSEGQITVKGKTIVAKGRMAKVRGALYDGRRITLIICDDLEDTDNTKTLESRQKTRSWFYTEVVPATEQGVLADDVKIVMLGNLVHRDCLLVNLDNKSQANGNIVKVLKFPLLDEEGNITWKGLYPDMEAVEKAKQKVMLGGEGLGAVIWAREYLLKMVDAEDQIIKDTDIQYFPEDWYQRKYEGGGVGVDLAISEKQTADFTSMVKAVFVRNDFGERRLMILPNPVKERMGFENTISKAKLIKTEMPEGTRFFVEDVAYQRAAIEIMQKNGINATGVKVSSDKRSRLTAISPYIKSGMVLFPKQGAEYILEELIGFGIEAHDDVVDALVHVIDGMLNTPQVVCV